MKGKQTMKKSLLLALLTLFMLSTTFHSYATVGTTNEEAQIIVDNANAKINSIIDKSQMKAAKVISQFEVGKLSLEEKDSKIDTIINQMVSKTNNISKSAIIKAAKLDITIQCSYIEVIIDSRAIMVDPLFIIGS